MIPEIRLPFCTLRRLEQNLIEAEVDEGVEMSLEQMRQAHEALTEIAEGRPCGVLVAKLHSYTYSFAAQREINNHPLMIAVGYFAPDATRRAAIRSLMIVSSAPARIPIELFESRDEALRWLRKQVETAGARVTAPPAR